MEDIPECQEVTKLYQDCAAKAQAKFWKTYNPAVFSKCEKKFNDYKDCLEVAMKLKLEREKAGKEN
jgi:hypothetical protein